MPGEAARLTGTQDEGFILNYVFLLLSYLCLPMLGKSPVPKGSLLAYSLLPGVGARTNTEPIERQSQ